MTKTEAIAIAKILQSLIGIAEVSIILSTFIRKFLADSIYKEDGMSYVHGNFNIAGPVSGRMSSNSPNMQNIPSTGTIYAKLVKEGFQAPPGYLLAGADFSSLEDKISALTTKDPNKLKVYMGHTIYELVIDGTSHHIRDDAIIDFEGKSYTGEGFYDYYTNR